MCPRSLPSQAAPMTLFPPLSLQLPGSQMVPLKCDALSHKEKKAVPEVYFMVCPSSAGTLHRQMSPHPEHHLPTQGLSPTQRVLL